MINWIPEVGELRRALLFDRGGDSVILAALVSPQLLIVPG
jgi:hypothetical protein